MKTPAVEGSRGDGFGGHQRFSFEQALPAELLGAEGILTALASVFFPTAATTAHPSYSFGEPGESKPSIHAEWPDVAARYRILVEQIPAVVFMAFLDKGIGEAYVSPQIEAMLGFTQEEWLHDPVRWYQQIHPDDKARWSVEAAHMLLTGEPLRSVYRMLARDRRVVWFHCEAQMVRRADGRPWFMHGVGFDITELKQAEEALSQREKMLRGIFEYAPDAMLLVDSNGCIERVNAQVERVFGYHRDALLGQPIEVLLPERFQQRYVEHRTSH